MLEHNQVEVDGATIHYIRGGSGKQVIVCLHGLGASSRYFAPLVDLLSDRYTVIAPDQPNSGKNRRSDEELSVPNMAIFYKQFMAKLNIQNSVLVGNSLGCQISVELLTNHPTSVRSAVLVNPTVNRHERSAFKQILRFMQAGRHEPISEALIQLQGFRQLGVVRTAKTLRYALENRIEQNLPRVQQPVLIIRGQKDAVCPQSWAEEATALLPDGRLKVIPNGTHAAHYSQSRQVAHMIDQFVKTVSC